MHLGQKVEHRTVELVVMGEADEVPGITELKEPRVRNSRRQGGGVGRRHVPVVLCGDDQRRHSQPSESASEIEAFNHAPVGRKRGHRPAAVDLHEAGALLQFLHQAAEVAHSIRRRRADADSQSRATRGMPESERLSQDAPEGVAEERNRFSDAKLFEDLGDVINETVEGDAIVQRGAAASRHVEHDEPVFGSPLFQLELPHDAVVHDEAAEQQERATSAEGGTFQLPAPAPLETVQFGGFNEGAASAQILHGRFAVGRLWEGDHPIERTADLNGFRDRARSQSASSGRHRTPSIAPECLNRGRAALWGRRRANVLRGDGRRRRARFRDYETRKVDRILFFQLDPMTGKEIVCKRVDVLEFEKDGRWQRQSVLFGEQCRQLGRSDRVETVVHPCPAGRQIFQLKLKHGRDQQSEILNDAGLEIVRAGRRRLPCTDGVEHAQRLVRTYLSVRG